MTDLRTAVNYSKASLGFRFANFFIDYFILVIVIAFFEIFIGRIFGMGSYSELIFLLMNLIVFVLFYSLQEIVFKGRTIGKFITRTKVVTVDGEEPSAEKYFIRSLCRMIPFEAFSFLFSSESGWHDTISNTRVVRISDFEEMKIKYGGGLDEIGKDWYKKGL